MEQAVFQVAVATLSLVAVRGGGLRAALVTCLTALLLSVGAWGPASHAAAEQGPHPEALDGLSRSHDAVLPAKAFPRIAAGLPNGLPPGGADVGGPMDLPGRPRAWPFECGAVQDGSIAPTSCFRLSSGAHRPRGPPRRGLEAPHDASQAPPPLVQWAVPVPSGRLPALQG